MEQYKQEFIQFMVDTEFYSLGLGDPYCISAVTGSGTGDMMDLIVSKFKKESDEILDEDIPRFAVVGRPNAGKSSKPVLQEIYIH